MTFRDADWADVKRVVLMLLAAIGLPVLAVYVGLTTTRGVQQPINYWLDDSGMLGVLVISGGGIDWSVASVTETPTLVKVDAQCNEHWLTTGGPGIAVPHAFYIRLSAGLDDRVVTDGLGKSAVRCEVVACGEVIPG